MGESESVSDRAAINPAPTMEIDEIVGKDKNESVESESREPNPASDRSDGNAGAGPPERRFNLRTRKPAKSEPDNSAQERDDESLPQTSYLGINGWIKLRKGSVLACGKFHEFAPDSSRNGGVTNKVDAKGTAVPGFKTPPSFTGKPSLISNSSKSDNWDDTIAGKKAALRQVVCALKPKSSRVAPVAKGTSKSHPKSVKKLKKSVKSELKAVILKAGKKAPLPLAGAAKASKKKKRELLPNTVREPSPFKPVTPKKVVAKKVAARNGSRISSYKSSRTVATELESIKSTGGRPGEYNITKITFDDVLLGRGNNLVTYEGNIRYRELVLQHRDRYIAAPRIEKGQIAKTVIETVWSRGGRFLESKDNDQTNWREAELPRLLEKATQALREKHAWKEHPERRDGVKRR